MYRVIALRGTPGLSSSSSVLSRVCLDQPPVLLPLRQRFVLILERGFDCSPELTAELWSRDCLCGVAFEPQSLPDFREIEEPSRLRQLEGTFKRCDVGFHGASPRLPFSAVVQIRSAG